MTILFGAIKVVGALASGYATGYAAQRFVWPRVKYYWRYDRPYDVAIVGHLVVLIVASLLGKRAGRYIYGRVF